MCAGCGLYQCVVLQISVWCKLQHRENGPGSNQNQDLPVPKAVNKHVTHVVFGCYLPPSLSVCLDGPFL